MEITPGSISGKIDSYVKQVNKDKTKSGAVSDKQRSNETSPSQDSVELSPQAKGMQEAMRILDTLPDVREDKVAQIKQQIEEGSYEIDGKKIAEKMIGEALVNDMS
jgi:negative regulator of flagellin synthesis FlgM